MTAALRKGWCPGALRPMLAKDGFVVRLRITGGILRAAQAHALADLAEGCGNGLLDLTGRGNLQMRGIDEGTLGRLQDGLKALGLLDARSEVEAVRNVMASPLAGLHDGLDIRPLAVALERRLAEDARLHALPAKFGFLIDDGRRPTLGNIDADVRFDWTGRRFEIGLGGTRINATQVGTCGPAEIPRRASQIAMAFLKAAEPHPHARRMRHIVDMVATACAAFPSPACGRGLADDIGSDEGQHRPVDDKDGGVARTRAMPAGARIDFPSLREIDVAQSVVGEHTFHHRRVLGAAAPFGRLNASMLRAAADSACDELRLTPWRVLLLPDTSVGHVPGFVTDPADGRLRVATCVGEQGCTRATTDTHADATVLAQTFSNEGIALHVSGCEKGCAKPSRTSVTLVARGGRYDLVRDGRADDPPNWRSLDLAAARDVLQAFG